MELELSICNRLMGDPAPPVSYHFAQTMAKALLAKSDGNFVFSPAGLRHMLYMLQEGMDRKSAIYRKVRDLLGGCYSEMETCKEDGFTLEHAASIWYNQSLGLINEDFWDTLEDEYDAEVREANFSLPNLTKRLVDEWASDYTNQMIKTLDLEISQYAQLLVLDAIYLKGKWENPFDPDYTETDTFSNADGSKSDVEMMFQNIERAEYAETGRYQLIELPYRNVAYSMALVLPKEGESIERILESDWTDCPTDTCEVELYLPRFHFDNMLPLNEALTELGLGDMFEKENCFPKISDEPASISQIKQQCVIRVEEEGTEAAAVTIAECVVGCLPPDASEQPPTMRIDRPFAFAIKQRYGDLLFMGVVKDMKQP